MCGQSEGSGNWQIGEIRGQDLDRYWGLIAPRLQEALNQGQGDGMPANELREGFETGLRQLWAIHDEDQLTAIAVICVERTPGVGLKIFVELLQGERMDEWIQLLVDTLYELKEMVGAFCIEASCRPGLGKYMQRLGWKHKATIMELR